MSINEVLMKDISTENNKLDEPFFPEDKSNESIESSNLISFINPSQVLENSKKETPITMIHFPSFSQDFISKITFSSKLDRILLNNLKLEFEVLFPITYPKNFFERLYKGEYKIIMIILQNGNNFKELIAFSIFEYDDKSNEATILFFGVSKEYQGKKIGSALLKKTIEEFMIKGVKEVKLIVQKTNIIAIHLYEKYGFKTEKVIKNYYPINKSNKSDGIQMKKQIKKEFNLFIEFINKIKCCFK